MKHALIIRVTICVSLFAMAMPNALAVILPRYSVSVDEQEVTDSQTKLIWRRCAEGTVFSDNNLAHIFMCMGTASVFTHEAALQHASAEANSSGKAWRLPNVKELSSLLVPQPNPIYFPCFPCSMVNSFIWSSTPGHYPDTVWTVYGSSNWYVDSSARSSTYSVWLVRDAQ